MLTDDPDFDPHRDLPCDTPGCPGIAWGAQDGGQPYCGACLADMPLCVTEGCIEPELLTAKEFCDQVHGLAKDERRDVLTGKCDCGLPLEYPLTTAVAA